MSEILGNATGGFGFPRTYVITDSNGNELMATYVESKTIFTATDNDVREGSVYAGDSGVSTGTKIIPAYHTYEGYRLITSGSTFKVILSDFDLYDYTKLLCVICPYNTSVSKSVATEKVAIENNVYLSNSTEVISAVIKDSNEKAINLGIVNDTSNLYIIRFFTYKEM